ncbi:MAG: hypothetical protein ACRDIY_01920 [Chloroflexota bacterium]
MALAVMAPTRIDATVAGLDAWLETMRGPGGYGGPVVHWWQQSLVFTGPALDWRYEGIIAGYLSLWERVGDARWLVKARRAGDDLVAGQLPDGHFAASAFELNPATAGTPHEAAADVGLLRLALALRTAGQSDWPDFAAAAERNLRRFYLGRLWDAEARAFRDSPTTSSFVPNKAATACEALFLLAEISGDAGPVEEYALPTLDRLLTHQARTAGNLDGAIAQNSLGARRVDKYFPIYIARCVPALVRGYRWTDDERFLDAAWRAMQFVARWRYPDGSFPTVVYPNRQVSRDPSWIAPLAEILRAADELTPFGFDADLGATLDRLLGGQDASGGIQTAGGFAAQAGGHLSSLPDVRDLLHVAGWCDKAFRYLASQVGPVLPTAKSLPFESACVFQGRTARLLETPDRLEVWRGDDARYRWRKGAAWAEVAAPEFWLH